MFGLKGLAFNLKRQYWGLTLIVLNKVTFSIARHSSKFPVECDIESRAIPDGNDPLESTSNQILFDIII